MKKSRILMLLLVFVISLSLFACGGTKPSGDENKGDENKGDGTQVEEFSKIEKLTIAGTDISEYVIVTGKDLKSMDKLMATKLQEQIARICGVTIPVVEHTATEAECEILLGNTGRAASSVALEIGHATAKQDGKKIVLYGNGEYANLYAIKYFINDVLGTIPMQKSYDIVMQGFEAESYENPNLAGTNMPLVLENYKETERYKTDFTVNNNILNRFYATMGEFPEEVTVLPRYEAESFPLSMQTQIFVAPDGNDANAGTIDAPLATIEAAAKKLTANGGVIWVRGGTYNTTVSLSNIIGTPVSPIIISAYADETPVFTAGKKLSPEDFADVNYANDPVAKRIPAQAQGKIAYVNLYNLGWTADDVGKIIGGSSGETKIPQLYVNSQLQSIARYPNLGEAELYFNYVFDTGSVTSRDGSNLYAGWIKRVKDGEFDNNPNVKFYTDKYNNKNLDWGWAIRMIDLTPFTWENTGNIWYYGNVFEGWEHGCYNILSFELATKKMTSKSGSAYGAKHSTNSPTGYNNYYLFNAIEALDAPGEWFFDPDTGILYLYKCEDFDNASIFYCNTANGKNLFSLQNCKNVIVNGLTIDISTDRGVYATGCDGVIIQGCKVSNTANYAIHLGTDTRNSAVTYCDVSQSQKEMIYTNPGGQAYAKLVPTRNIIQNNYCHDPRAQVTTGVYLNGYLNVASHNYLDDCRISVYYCAESIVEYNDISGGSRDVSDAGLIYVYGFYSHGNHVRYNYLHNWKAPGSGVYLDDLDMGQYVYYNIIDASSATSTKDKNLLYTSTGHYNVFYGNLLIGRKNKDRIHESCLYFDNSTSLGYRFAGLASTLATQVKNYYGEAFLKRFPEMDNFFNMIKQYVNESTKSGYVRNENEVYLRSPNNNIVLNNILLGCSASAPIYQPTLEKTNSVTKKPFESLDYIDFNYISQDVEGTLVDLAGGNYAIKESALPAVKAALNEYFPLSTENIGPTYSFR
jgi:hypothetical protein